MIFSWLYLFIFLQFIYTTPAALIPLVTTLAGRTDYGNTNGEGTNAQFSSPFKGDISPDGTKFIVTDIGNNLIRQITITTSTVITLAGQAGVSGSTNGEGTNALFNSPNSITYSLDGSYALITDSFNHLIRKIILSTAAVTTFAGGTSSGNTNGEGTNALFSSPHAIAISPDGLTAVVAEFSNNMIRIINISTSVVSTLAGQTTAGSDNGIGTLATFDRPYGVDYFPDGSAILVADTSNHLIRKIILTTADVTTLAGVAQSSGSTNGVGTNSRLYNPMDVRISLDGSYALVADRNNFMIRSIILSTLFVDTIIGTTTSGTTNGVGTNALLDYPFGVAIEPNGEYFLICDAGNNMIRNAEWVNEPTIIPTFTPSSNPTYAPSSTPSVDPSLSPTFTPSVAPTISPTFSPTAPLVPLVTTLAGRTTSGSTNGEGTNAQFKAPFKGDISPDGTTFLVADSNNHLLRKVIISTATVSTLAGLAGVSGSTNGAGTNARFSNPNSIWYYPDSTYALMSDTINNLIRKIVISTAVVTRFAGGGSGTTSGNTNGAGTNALFSWPYAICISSDGSFAVVADYNNNRIRMIIISTVAVSTLAGASSGSSNGVGTLATFTGPTGVDISPDGTVVLVAEEANHLIRKIIISTAEVTTLAGVAATTGSTNGIGTNARLNRPHDARYSSDGLSAFIPDFGNNMIRKIILSTLFVDTIIGTTSSGTTNGIGTNARLNGPINLAMAPGGLSFILVDYSNNMIRYVELVYNPTSSPSVAPTFTPSATPTFTPSITPSAPTVSPTYKPSVDPTLSPTFTPSTNPTLKPTSSPSLAPTFIPSSLPTFSPSSDPTLDPTYFPSTSPTFSPTVPPTFQPSATPTPSPTFSPSADPTLQPTSSPSSDPTFSPSSDPTFAPSSEPTFSPTTDPTLDPTYFPSSSPSSFPSAFPSFQPTAQHYTLTCPPYSAQFTSNATQNTTLCSFWLCPYESVSVSLCDTCNSTNTFIRLLDSSDVEIAFNDKGGSFDCGSCSSLSFIYNQSTVRCDKLSLHQGCRNSESCVGESRITIEATTDEVVKYSFGVIFGDTTILESNRGLLLDYHLNPARGKVRPVSYLVDPSVIMNERINTYPSTDWMLIKWRAVHVDRNSNTINTRGIWEDSTLIPSGILSTWIVSSTTSNILGFIVQDLNTTNHHIYFVENTINLSSRRLFTDTDTDTGIPSDPPPPPPFSRRLSINNPGIAISNETFTVQSLRKYIKEVSNQRIYLLNSPLEIGVVTFS